MSISPHLILKSSLFILVTKFKYRYSLPLPPKDGLFWAAFSGCLTALNGFIGQSSKACTVSTFNRCYLEIDHVLVLKRACRLCDSARQAGYHTEHPKQLRQYLREEVICIFWTA